MILWDFVDDSITIKETETASPSQGSSPFISKSNQAKVVDEMSNAEAYDVEEREGDILKEASSFSIFMHIF